MPSNPDPQKYKDAGMPQAFNPQPDPSSIAGMIAQAYAARMNGQQPPTPAAQTNAPTAQPNLSQVEQQTNSNPHMAAMQDVAEAAKQKYMQENGVDENGDPVQK